MLWVDSTSFVLRIDSAFLKEIKDIKVMGRTMNMMILMMIFVCMDFKSNSFIGFRLVLLTVILTVGLLTAGLSMQKKLTLSNEDRLLD